MPRSDREYLLRYAEQVHNHLDKAGLQMTSAMQLLQKGLGVTDEQLQDDYYLTDNYTSESDHYNKVLLMGMRDFIPEIAKLMETVDTIREYI